ncbi:Aste57867_15237 [Aphanomyces stellatus]|uniref:Aste57867_15237 protein n=1 Tax=Aphanomyces stellatus TaxID=120398 RepID=A0A485L2P1_9STRA|nr:hypothetical protein As57867_015181 [Aphanomyces stellatus]VFT92046.1 Aste57867_15237 [Aphanomyces stellatus]
MRRKHARKARCQVGRVEVQHMRNQRNTIRTSEYVVITQDLGAKLTTVLIRDPNICTGSCRWFAWPCWSILPLEVERRRTLMIGSAVAKPMVPTAPSSSSTLTSLLLIGLLCFLKFLDAFDSNIVAGAPAQIQFFIQTSKNTTETGALLGLLNSAFITSFSVCMLLFGYLAEFMRPFRVVSIGVAIIVVAAFLSAISKRANSFELLFLGRLLSGAGEGALACITPAFIDTHAPPHLRSLFIGINFTSETVGSVVGSIAASLASTTSLGWDGLYAIEGLVLLPVLGVCLCGVPVASDTMAAPTTLDDGKTPTETDRLLHNPATLQTHNPTTADNNNHSFLHELGAVCHNPVFVWLSIGSALSAFSSTGVQTFTTLLLLGLGVFADETDANVTMGTQMVVLGIIGTLVGSAVLDWTCRAAPDRLQFFALRQLAVGVTCMVVFSSASILALPSRVWFLVGTSCAGIIGAMVMPVLTIALLHSVEPSRRALTTGVYTLLLHVFGDVPAPIVMGALKDKLAPHCNSIVVGDLVKMNPNCIQDKDGLMAAMTFPIILLVASLGGYWMALYASSRRPSSKEDTLA